MRGRLLSLLALAVITAPLFADDKPDMAKLKKELAAAEAKVAELKGQLAKAEGKADAVPTEFKNVGKFTPKAAEVGYEGKISAITGLTMDAHEVYQVIDPNTYIIVAVPGKPEQGKLVVVDSPTKGLADGKIVNGERVWQVIGTRKVSGETLYVMREKAAELKTDPKNNDPPKKK